MQNLIFLDSEEQDYFLTGGSLFYVIKVCFLGDSQSR
jgi:hypothetical protein